MDRMIKTLINGEERDLNYSIEVMFKMTDKFKDVQNALEAINDNNKKGFEAVRWFAVEMANDAELCRKEAGYEPRKMLKESDISARMKPLEFVQLRENVVAAIVAGYVREEKDEDEETDLGLMELQSKKTETGE